MTSPDAAPGVIEEGEADSTALLHAAPYPEAEYAEALRLGPTRLLGQTFLESQPPGS